MNRDLFEFYSGTFEAIMPFVIGISFVIYAGVIVFKQWRLQYRSPDNDNAPVLFSYFSQGNDLIAADKHDLKNVVGGASSVTLITMPRKFGTAADIAVPSGKAIKLVELPFRSRLHLLAISKGGNLDQLNPTIGVTAMDAVSLEGDFGNYFSLYIDKGQDFKLRYLLDPEAMAYVADFCHKYHWEIIDDVMYIASKSTPAKDNLIADFIAQIRPVLETKENTPVRPKQKKAKTWPQLSKFKCPICHNNMKEYRHWHECPNGHGQLILGAKLTDAETKQEALSEKDTKQDNEKHQNLICPACGKNMTPVNYGGSKTVIDACTSCYYRWLDAGELKSIHSRPKY